MKLSKSLKKNIIHILVIPPSTSSTTFSWHLQTFSCMSRVSSVNLLSSVKRVGQHWRTCRLWCLLANVSQDAQIWEVSNGPLKNVGSSCQLHGVCFWHFGQNHAHQWPAGGNFYCSSSAVQCSAVFLLLLLDQRGRPKFYCWVYPYLQPCPALLVDHPSPGISSKLSRLYWETKTFLVTICMNVPFWRSRTTSTTWLGCR